MSIVYSDLFGEIAKFAENISPLAERIIMSPPTAPFKTRMLQAHRCMLPQQGLYVYLRPDKSAVYIGMSKGLNPKRNIYGRAWQHLGNPSTLVPFPDCTYEFGFPQHQWATNLALANPALHDLFTRGEILVSACAVEPIRCIRLLEGYGIWRLKQTGDYCLNKAD